MSWDKESLSLKAKYFFEKGLKEDKADIAFGLWYAMGLELLARAAIAGINPVLLAEPDKDQKNILSALGLSVLASKKSITTSQVISLCKALIKDFTDDHQKIATAMASRRNEEVHSGSAAFVEYPPSEWLTNFYKCSGILAASLDKDLKFFFGDVEGAAADKMLSETNTKICGETMSKIAAFKQVFLSKEQEEREKLSAEAEASSKTLSNQGHHKVSCPACNSIATVQGDVYGAEKVEHGDGEIIVRQDVMPNKFACIACGLKLNGFGQLSAAKLADNFQHRINYTPEDYYGLIHPDDDEAMREYAEDHGYYHFSND